MKQYFEHLKETNYAAIPCLMPFYPVNKQTIEDTKHHKVSKWHQIAIKSAARRDNLEIFHWEKVITAATEAMQIDGNENGQGQPPAVVRPEYPYDKFNTELQIPEYTDQEYDELLKGFL
jgi:hypothetical protein